MHTSYKKLTRDDLLCIVVNELLEAGADPTIPNKDGDLPADLLAYGTKARSQLGQDLVARLKRGQAEMNISSADIANDDDVADDDEGVPTAFAIPSQM